MKARAAKGARRHVRWACFVVAFSVWLPSSGWAKKGLPPWAESELEGLEAAYARVGDDAKALVLSDRGTVSYSEGGQRRSRKEFVVHIASRDERDFAHVVIPMTNRTQKLLKFNAWIRYPSGRVESFAKRDLLEVADNMKALYSEAKMLVLDRTDSVRDGTVFAYEYETTEKTVFTQAHWYFQHEVPTALSRVEVSIPKGWSMQGVVLSGEQISSAVDETTAYWEARDLPGVKDEPARLPTDLLYAQVGVTISPASTSIGRHGLQRFATWNDLARYGSKVQEDRITPSQAIKDKAGELVAGARDRWEALQRVAAYAQSLNYVMIDLNLNSGGGYTPQPATDVFRNHYGDCKDMTALTRSLLLSQGIDSYAVLASIGEEAYVHDEWPSPMQFNHCIVGIPVDDTIDCPAVVEDAVVGRVLIFDPTQRYTPLGQLPASLQGTKALVASDVTQGLVALPLLPERQNAVQREITAQLDAAGTLNGTIREELTGSNAEYVRYVYRSSSDDDFKNFLKSWISRGTRDAVVHHYNCDDRFEDHQFELEVQFSAPGYARIMAQGMMVFSPIFLSRHEWVPPVLEKRVSTYVSKAWTLDETSRFVLPEGYVIDARSEALAKEASFLAYNLSFHDTADGLESRRLMQSRPERVPVARYPELVDCYEEVTRAESAPVVLLKRKG